MQVGIRVAVLEITVRMSIGNALSDSMLVQITSSPLYITVSWILDILHRFVLKLKWGRAYEQDIVTNHAEIYRSRTPPAPRGYY